MSHSAICTRVEQKDIRRLSDRLQRRAHCCTSTKRHICRRGQQGDHGPLGLTGTSTFLRCTRGLVLRGGLSPSTIYNRTQHLKLFGRVIYAGALCGCVSRYVLEIHGVSLPLQMGQTAEESRTQRTHHRCKRDVSLQPSRILAHRRFNR